MGRPRKAQRRDCQLNIRLTTDEFKLVEDHAKEHDEEPVAYGRRVILEGAGSTEVMSLPAKFDRLVELQLRRLGNLLNQLVRHMHLTGEVPPDATSLLRDVRILIDRCLS